MQLEVNAVGRTVRVLDRRESQPGIDLTLGIDLDLQRTAVSRLGSESGSVVVVDVHMGEILVMASTPAYDPEAFNRGLSAQEWKTLVSDPKTPLVNKAISGLYAPGSTFKPVVALAGLERGVITPSTVVLCAGVLRLGNFSFHCWRRGGHGSVRLREALMQSCDCYFYEVAKRVGVDRIAQMGRRLGLGGPLGVDLPHERGGFLPTRSWKMAAFGTPWSMGETVITGIGQGYVLSTPLQLAVMTARIANGGRAIVPHLARDADRAKALAYRAVRMRPRSAPPTSGWCKKACTVWSTVSGGTARGSVIRIPGSQWPARRARRKFGASREPKEKPAWSRTSTCLGKSGTMRCSSDTRLTNSPATLSP